MWFMYNMYKILMVAKCSYKMCFLKEEKNHFSKEKNDFWRFWNFVKFWNAKNQFPFQKGPKIVPKKLTLEKQPYCIQILQMIRICWEKKSRWFDSLSWFHYQKYFKRVLKNMNHAHMASKWSLLENKMVWGNFHTHHFLRSFYCHKIKG